MGKRGMEVCKRKEEVHIIMYNVHVNSTYRPNKKNLPLELDNVTLMLSGDGGTAAMYRLIESSSLSV